MIERSSFRPDRKGECEIRAADGQFDFFCHSYPPAQMLMIFSEAELDRDG